MSVLRVSNRWERCFSVLANAKGYFNIGVENGKVAYLYLSSPDSDGKIIRSQMDIEERSYADGNFGAKQSLTDAAWTKTLQTLNDSRISLYPIRVGWVTDCCLRPADDSPKNGLESLARGTGGSRLLEKEVDLASAIAGLRRQFGAYYVLTITPGSASKEVWTACTVGVSKPDLKAVTPEGFFSSH